MFCLWALKSLKIFTLTDKVATIILVKALCAYVPDSLPRSGIVGTPSRCTFNFAKSSQCGLPKCPC